MTSPLFIGIGVGPGDPHLITLAGLEAMRASRIIYAPRARPSHESLAKRIVDAHGIAAGRFREFVFETEQAEGSRLYARLAEEISRELDRGRQVAYLTLGDSMTYSTFAYTLDAVRLRCPEVRVRTIPGVTSYCAVASETAWPLGEGKERVLILPCPEHMQDLATAIREHDLVILMKVGKRLGQVMALIRDMRIARHCVLGQRVGMPEARILTDLAEGPIPDRAGYLSTMLIRKQPRPS